MTFSCPLFCKLIGRCDRATSLKHEMETVEVARAHKRITWILDDYVASIPTLDCLPGLLCEREITYQLFKAIVALISLLQEPNPYTNLYIHILGLQWMRTAVIWLKRRVCPLFFKLIILFIYLFFFFLVFFFKHLYWSITALHWCVSFCFITK